MDCMDCWFRNPDRDFDANHPSDSESVGLAETDDEFGRNIYNNQYYHNNNNNDDNIGEQTRTQILHNNTIQNSRAQPFVCHQCTKHERKILQLESKIREYKNRHSNDLQNMKRKYNKLVDKYMHHKKQLTQLSLLHKVNTEQIENYKIELNRLSANNEKILKEKNINARDRDSLRTKNLHLEIEMNDFKQKIHELKMKNKRFQTEYGEKRRKRKSIQNKYEEPIVRNRNFSQSLQNIHELKEEGIGGIGSTYIGRQRSKSAPQTPDSSPDVSHQINLSPVDEAKEDSSKSQSKDDHHQNNQQQHPLPHQQPYLQKNVSSSVSIDESMSYNYDDDVSQNGAQFVVRSASNRNMMVDANMYANYTNYYPQSTRSVNSFYPNFGAKTSSADTPVSPMSTAMGHHQIHDSVFDIPNYANAHYVRNTSDDTYVDDDGVDEMSNDGYTDGQYYKIKIDEIKHYHKNNRDHLSKQLSDIRSQLSNLKNSNNDTPIATLRSNVSSNYSDDTTGANNDDIDDNHNSNNNNNNNDGNEDGNKIKENRRNSMPVSFIDLKRTQRINEKMQLVSLENTALKHKNAKLSKDIKELKKQLSQTTESKNDKNNKKKTK